MGIWQCYCSNFDSKSWALSSWGSHRKENQRRKSMDSFWLHCPMILLGYNPEWFRQFLSEKIVLGLFNCCTYPNKSVRWHEEKEFNYNFFMENRRNIHLFKLRTKKIERKKMKEEADRSISQEYKFLGIMSIRDRKIWSNTTYVRSFTLNSLWFPFFDYLRGWIFEYDHFKQLETKKLKALK